MEVALIFTFDEGASLGDAIVNTSYLCNVIAKSYSVQAYDKAYDKVH